MGVSPGSQSQEGNSPAVLSRTVKPAQKTVASQLADAFTKPVLNPFRTFVTKKAAHQRLFEIKMDAPTIILIAFSLAIDASAVSIANGITITHQRYRSALTIALCFGAFQMLMPLIVWMAGLGFEEFIMGVDHWIALILLTVTGSKMIYDSTKKETEKTETRLKIFTLLTMSIATSIDALAVGLSFAFLETYIVTPIITIGIVTFALSLIGFFFGRTVGNLFGNKIKMIGGPILIGIGIRIFIEHLG